MHTRLPGLRQGTTVCVHTSMDMEQRSDLVQVHLFVGIAIRPTEFPQGKFEFREFCGVLGASSRVVMFPLRFGWTMVTFWSIFWQNWIVNIAWRLGCRVLGLTVPTAGLHNTLRPVHQQADWVVGSACAQGLVEPSSRWLGRGK